MVYNISDWIEFANLRLCAWRKFLYSLLPSPKGCQLLPPCLISTVTYFVLKTKHISFSLGQLVEINSIQYIIVVRLLLWVDVTLVFILLEVTMPMGVHYELFPLFIYFFFTIIDSITKKSLGIIQNPSFWIPSQFIRTSMVISHYDADCHDRLCSGCSAQSETSAVYLHLLIVILINQNYLKSTQTLTQACIHSRNLSPIFAKCK